jgi:hypothetical protein
MIIEGGLSWTMRAHHGAHRYAPVSDGEGVPARVS